MQEVSFMPLSGGFQLNCLRDASLGDASHNQHLFKAHILFYYCNEKYFHTDENNFLSGHVLFELSAPTLVQNYKENQLQNPAGNKKSFR